MQIVSQDSLDVEGFIAWSISLAAPCSCLSLPKILLRCIDYVDFTSLLGKRTVIHLGPSHTGRRSVGVCLGFFRAAHQRRFKFLHLRPVCAVCGARQLVLIFVAMLQNHSTRGTEVILFLTPDAWY